MSSRRNKRGGEEAEAEERWLLPYADMITLLLGLFIVLFAMSTIDSKQYDNVRRSLSETFKGDVLEEPGGVLSGADGVLDPAAPADTSDERVIELATAAKEASARFDREAKSIERVVKQANLGNDVKVTRNERGITVSLAGDALFDSGSAQLKPGIQARLTQLERKLASFHRPIEIAGHTDGAPFHEAGGNWALSLDRALAVLLFFRDKGYPEKLMKPTGYADLEPVKAPPKGNPTASVAKNRRIEITILEPGVDDPVSAELRLPTTANPVTGPTNGADAKRANGTSKRPVDPQLEAELDAGIVSELAQTARGAES